MSRKSLHYTSLVGAIALGAILRWWHLDLKPLWMDEVITAIFSLGKNYLDLPLDVVFPGAQLREIFTWKAGVSCAQIAQNIANQSTHPPLFFCWMHSWLGWMSLGKDWVASLRSLSALYGVGAIVVIYFVNRIAFSPTAGIMAAVLMAVSPFAIYLSQEARHYTLPMLLISLALLGLVQIQRDIEQRQIVRFPVWLFWAIINSIGLYVHYFFVIAFIAQIATLITTQHRILGLQLRNLPEREGRKGRKIWLALILSVSGVALSFLPWLAIVLNHFNRSETNWLDKPNHIAPLYHTLIGWILMVITLPVENQPLSIKVISGLLMLLFSVWVGWQVFKGIKQLWCTPSTHLSTLTLLSFSGWVLLEFFALVYLSKKDITTVPRYNFVYYPSFCALIAASFCQRQNNDVRRNSFLILVLVSVLSSIFVISNLVFQKPFQPERVAQNMNLEPTTPLMVVVGYRDYQDVALGLSFALALEPLRETKGTTNFAFFKQSPDFDSVWQKLSQLPTPQTSKLNLWVVGPGRRRRDYPKQVVVSGQTTCQIDTQQHYRIGVPYQLYRCEDFKGT